MRAALAAIALLAAVTTSWASAARGWQCTSRDGQCYLDRETCATGDRDGSGQDSPSCHWVRHAWVTTVTLEDVAAPWAFETEQICDRFRRDLRRRGIGARSTPCRYRAPEAVRP